MVKRQKEKQYQSAREHRANSQLRAGTTSSNSKVQRRLPFNCCALSLTPYEHPVCNADGIVFENSALLPFLLKHKVDPVSGKKMTSRDIITLNMDKDEEGRWQCPVLTKPFSDHVKIVAIIQNPPGNEANVYSYEAFQELNLKAKNYEDLISGKKFHKTKDVIILNDPDIEEHNQKRDISNFHHMLHSRKAETSNTASTNVRHSVTAARIMETIEKKRKSENKSDNDKSAIKPDVKKMKIFTDEVSGQQLTSGKCSGSLTSTVMDISSENIAREATEEEILNALFATMRKRKKKGYVTLHTNMGNIGLELHCDIAPRTCMNFIGLAEAGKYNGCSFHRLIPNFMIQGGKPPKSSDDTDSSLWGEPFKDEFDDRLVHSGSGILSMANAGPGTNKRQFFITFKSCQHLDRKHSVFGRVVQGLDILQSMERVPTDKKDRPMNEIKIIRAEVLVNPVKEAEELERVRIEERAEAKRKEQEARKNSALGKKKQVLQPGKKKSTESKTNGTPTVGKYLAAGLVNSNGGDDKADSSAKQAPAPSRLPPPPKKTSFGDFSGW